MKNLAGDPDCDRQIESELTRCGVQVVRNQPRDGEVQSSLRGKLGNFGFFRVWRYWIATGRVPLQIARELYDDPVGRTDIRVNGDCSRPPPEGRQILWLDRKDRKLLPMSEWNSIVNRWGEDDPIVKEVRNDPKIRFVNNPAAKGKGFIDTYHIDTETGLRVFADTLKKHKLV
jgi:hypothetical protein